MTGHRTDQRHTLDTSKFGGRFWVSFLESPRWEGNFHYPRLCFSGRVDSEANETTWVALGGGTGICKNTDGGCRRPGGSLADGRMGGTWFGTHYGPEKWRWLFRFLAFSYSLFFFPRRVFSALLHPPPSFPASLTFIFGHSCGKVSPFFFSLYLTSSHAL
ncbi:hypothetical protein BDP81DRAFT_416075 [Colletotrichum phormii]|uniref:Uncharacterized protein n=1 Tax=Colletotrichum phormii TaxID=359342 RepID=A0AAJ0EJY9_9PEZI|nr:uncharacterized protein BDP81DRAFT_416075 [Colletotrichum phormii]KAK1654586.1 hypothetical protein BDP81DRAFT_416075 [Colletotrichum phormii]